MYMYPFNVRRINKEIEKEAANIGCIERVASSYANNNI